MRDLRIIGRDWYASLFVLLAQTLLALLLFFILNQWIRYLNDASNGKVALLWILQALWLELPHLTALLLPLAWYLSLLILLNRQQMHGELVAWQSFGLSGRDFLKILAKPTLLLAALVAWLNFYGVPHWIYQRDLFLKRQGTETWLSLIRAKHFQTLPGHQTTFYVREINTKKDSWKDIFIALPSNHHSWQIITAKSAKFHYDQHHHHHTLILAHGNRYEGFSPSTPVELLHFDALGMHLYLDPPNNKREANAIPTSQLGHQLTDIAQWHWRAGIPISLVVLSITALGLIQKNRRGSWLGNLPLALLIYLGYANGLFMARAWIQHGTIPSILGFWWLHAFFLGLACWCYRRRW